MMIKRLFLFALLLPIINQIKAQTAEEILAQYIEATGGQTNWENIHSVKVMGTAKLISQGMELPFTRIMEKDGKQKATLQVNGQDYVSIACDGQRVWGFNPQMQPALKGADETKNTILQANDFPFPGFQWKERGYQLELLGEAKIDAGDTYKIKLTKQPQWLNGQEVENNMILYIDQKTFLLLRSDVIDHMGNTPDQITTSIFSNYQNRDGYLYPCTVSMQQNGKIFQILESKNVEWNIEIEETIYAMPKQ